MMRFEFSTDAVPHREHREFETFCESLNNNAGDGVQRAEALLKQADLSGLYKAQVNLFLAREYALNGNADLAKVCNDAVLNTAEATMKQKKLAAAQNSEL